MKKKLIWALVVSCLIAILAVTASAEILHSGECGENLKWTLDEHGKLTISGTGDMANYNSMSPKVPWENYKSDIKYVIIESGVTSVGEYAFYKHGQIINVTFGSDLTKIGKYAFYECTFTQLNLSDNITYIGGCAFSSCEELLKVNLPDKLENLDKSVFSRCNNLKYITLPAGLKTIGNGCFSRCESLYSIKIPHGVEILDFHVFEKCDSLEVIEIPSTVIAISHEAFWQSNRLNKIYFGGTQEQWETISFGVPLDGITVIFSNNTGDNDDNSSEQSDEDVYVLTYNANGGIEPPSPVTAESGYKVIISSEILTRENYEFLGWAKTSDASEPEYKGGDSIILTANTTLYAVWKKVGAFDTQIVLTIGETAANVNGKTVYNDVAPILENSRTMLPARFVAENLGATVSWNDAEQKVVIKNDTATVEIVIGSNTAYVNDEAKTLDAPAFLRNSRTYTPVRFICESLGAEVQWKEATQQVIITK